MRAAGAALVLALSGCADAGRVVLAAGEAALAVHAGLPAERAALTARLEALAPPGLRAMAGWPMLRDALVARLIAADGDGDGRLSLAELRGME